MPSCRPHFLVSGEHARLFPVLATTSKEGRTTSIFLSCLVNVEEFGRSLLATVGQRVGKRGQLEAFTEVVFRSDDAAMRDRPDGLVVLRVGTREWRALIEAKVGNATLDAEQVERYRALAKDNGVDCVITISNQFASSAQAHPLEQVRKKKSRIPVHHWSWMQVLTTADLLLNNDGIADADQVFLLNELRRFLTHESAGVKGFDRMTPEWSELCRLVSAGGAIPARSPEAVAVLEARHQETQDLSLILTRQTETPVSQKLPRKHAADPAERVRDELARLRESGCLGLHLEVPDAAAPIEVVVDLNRRCVDVGMSLKAPQDRVSSKARLNWLLRQIRTAETEDLYIRATWPGKSDNTTFPIGEIAEDPGKIEEGKEHLQVLGFHVFHSKRLAGRFAQQQNFIADLEAIVPGFYGEVGQSLVAWRKSAPKIRDDRRTAGEVDVDAIGEEAETDAAQIDG